MRKRKPRGYWTKEKVKKEIVKYKSIRDFQKNNKGLYSTLCKRKLLHWLKSLRTRKPKNYWTKDRCLKEAKKYKHRINFKNKSHVCYTMSCKNGWLNNICKHMVPLGSLYKRLVYAAEFKDGFVYVGITCNYERRKTQHLTSGASCIYKHIKKTTLKPIFKVLTSLLKIEKAILYEEKNLLKYKKAGYKILNSAKTGGLGGGQLRITKEECEKEAKKYLFLRDFRKHSSLIYAYSVKYRYIKDFLFLKRMHPESYRAIKIDQYSLNNKFIKTFNSASEASRKLKINRGNITSCASQKYNKKSAGGFIWKYAN